jgi:hypothetical protein
MSNTRPRAPSRPLRAERIAVEVPRLTPPPDWQRTRQGQLATRLALRPARGTAQRQIHPSAATPIARVYMATVVARLGDPHQRAAEIEPEAGA